MDWATWWHCQAIAVSVWVSKETHTHASKVHSKIYIFSVGVITLAIGISGISLASIGISIHRRNGLEKDRSISSRVNNQLSRHNQELYTPGWLIFVVLISLAALTIAHLGTYVSSVYFNIVAELFPNFVCLILLPSITILRNKSEVQKFLKQL